MKRKNKHLIEIVPARPIDKDAGHDWSLKVYHNRSQSTVVDLTHTDLLTLTLAALATCPEVIELLRDKARRAG